MNGWLVLGRCGMDDVPLGLFETREFAASFAANVTEDDIIDAAPRVIGCDVSIILHVSLIEFRAGVPGLMEHVKSFDDPDAPADAEEATKGEHA